MTGSSVGTVPIGAPLPRAASAHLISTHGGRIGAANR
jgi:hypothetical protein